LVRGPSLACLHGALAKAGGLASYQVASHPGPRRLEFTRVCKHSIPLSSRGHQLLKRGKRTTGSFTHHQARPSSGICSRSLSSPGWCVAAAGAADCRWRRCGPPGGAGRGNTRHAAPPESASAPLRPRRPLGERRRPSLAPRHSTMTVGGASCETERRVCTVRMSMADRPGQLVLKCVARTGGRPVDWSVAAESCGMAAPRRSLHTRAEGSPLVFPGFRPSLIRSLARLPSVMRRFPRCWCRFLGEKFFYVVKGGRIVDPRDHVEDG